MKSSALASPAASVPVQLDRLTVSYPSGRTFDIGGSFSLTPFKDWLLPTIWRDPQNVMILDARGIVSCRGIEIYSPRNNPMMPPDLAEWMEQNPQWARDPLCSAN